MKSMAGLEIYAYWDELRGKSAAPRREDIEPSKLKTHLGDLFILTDKGEETPFFRLAGTRLCDLFGRELRDRPFSELWPAAGASFPVAWRSASCNINCPWSSTSMLTTATAMNPWRSKCCCCHCARKQVSPRGSSARCFHSSHGTTH